jgi:hypothetical protein
LLFNEKTADDFLLKRIPLNSERDSFVLQAMGWSLLRYSCSPRPRPVRPGILA